MKELKLNKRNEILIKIVIILSLSTIGIILLPFYIPKVLVYNSLLTLFIATIIITPIPINKLAKKKLNCSLLMGAYVDSLMIFISNDRLLELGKDILFLKPMIPTILSILIYPSIVFCIYYWLEKHHPIIKKQLLTLSKLEKKYLKIVGIMSILLVSIISVYTNAFQDVSHEGKFIVDVVYTSDNGVIFGGDAWFQISHPENDIRQPLFGLFALPFSIPAHAISEILFFVPKNISYGVLLSIIQFLLLAFTTIMLSRLLKLEEYQKKFFYIFVSLSFPYLLFGLLIEQYVIALFYLILTIYQYEELKEDRNNSYLGAVSTLITSGIIFSLAIKFKSLKDSFKKYSELFISFFILLILGGQFSQLMTIHTKMNFFMRDFAGKVPFIVKWNQYTTWIENLFKINPGHIEQILDYKVYRLSLPTSVSIIGVIVLGLLVVSFLLNRKEKIARISFIWIVFSFIILCIVGWGTKENGLILYSLYFAWAFYCLFFLLLKKIIKNKKVFSTIMIIIIGIMFIYTIKELYNIIIFALHYYHR